MTIFITGSTGFVGRQLVQSLLEKTTATLRLARRDAHGDLESDRVSYFKFSSLAADTQWEDGLIGCDAVIHLAARVHVMQEKEVDPLSLYREVNVNATLNLARQAAKANVKRFIYLSSIKVNGEETKAGVRFRPDDKVSPICPYGLSKFEAELGLLQIAKETGLEVVIIRPPLVYGPGVKGNFLRMLSWVDKGIPLPLGNIQNQRSFVSVYNLVDLISVCLTHPNAVNQIFLVSDGDDLSTSALLGKMASAMGRSGRCIALPTWLIAMMSRLLGQVGVFQRLWGSLQVDISKTCTMLEWQPKQKMERVLEQTYKK